MVINLNGVPIMSFDQQNCHQASGHTRATIKSRKIVIKKQLSKLSKNLNSSNINLEGPYRSRCGEKSPNYRSCSSKLSTLSRTTAHSRKSKLEHSAYYSSHRKSLAQFREQNSKTFSQNQVIKKSNFQLMPVFSSMKSYTGGTTKSEVKKR